MYNKRMHAMDIKCGKLFVVLGFSLLVSSCMNHHIYPPSWPQLEVPAPNACPILSGAYKNIGHGEIAGQCLIKNGRLSGYCYALSDYLFSEHVDVDEATTVEIMQAGDERLEVEFLSGAQSIQQRTFYKDKGDYSCTSNGLTIKRPRESAADGTGFGMGWPNVTFRKGHDGSLVMSESGYGFGMLLYLIPFVGSSTQWYRWETFTEQR